MSRRFWFVSLSIAAHLGVGFGVFASGIWEIDRLDRDNRPLSTLAVFLPDQAAPSGGGMQLPTERLTPKPKKPVKGPTQPVDKKPIDLKAASDSDDTGEGPDKGPGKGPGNPDDDGTCLIPPCGPAKQPVVDPPKPPVVVEPPKDILVPPNVLSLMRISGDTQIHPSETTKNQMLHEGRKNSNAVVKVCVSQTGAITSTTLILSSKYAAYDQLLLAGVKTWKYKPYMTNGQTVNVCGTTTFQYVIK